MSHGTSARQPESAPDLATRVRRTATEFARGWRQFWQGYWQSAHSC